MFYDQNATFFITSQNNPYLQKVLMSSVVMTDDYE